MIIDGEIPADAFEVAQPWMNELYLSADAVHGRHHEAVVKGALPIFEPGPVIVKDLPVQPSILQDLRIESAVMHGHIRHIGTADAEHGALD